MSAVHPEFKGKRALITGGTQGIGKAIALQLARQGAFVYLNYARNDQAAGQALEEFRAEGYAAELCKADLSSTESVEQMLDRIHESGPLDYLVCNAAYQEKNRGIFETDLALMHKTVGINIFSNFQMIQRVAREMVAAKRKGSVVICSSGHGSMVFTGTLAYDVSKAGLNHLMRGAALDLAPYGIRVNALEIGWTHTPGERRWFTEEEQNALSKTIPIGRAARADEIAAVLEFLLSDQASYVTGSLYGADGGFKLRPNPET
jgi:glucose 1-dehydrogenase